MNDSIKEVQQEIAPCDNKIQSQSAAENKKNQKHINERFSFRKLLFSDYFYGLTHTKKIVYLALMVAISYVLNVLSIPILNTNQISLIFVPIFVAALCFGTIPAIVVGGMGDLLQALTLPKGPFNPLITIAYISAGLIAGLIFVAFKKMDKRDSLLVSSILILIVSQLLINTTANYIYLLTLEFVPASAKDGWWLYLMARLPWCALTAFVNYAVMFAIIKSNILQKIFRTR